MSFNNEVILCLFFLVRHPIRRGRGLPRHSQYSWSSFRCYDTPPHRMYHLYTNLVLLWIAFHLSSRLAHRSSLTVTVITPTPLHPIPLRPLRLSSCPPSPAFSVDGTSATLVAHISLPIFFPYGRIFFFSYLYLYVIPLSSALWTSRSIFFPSCALPGTDFFCLSLPFLVYR